MQGPSSLGGTAVMFRAFRHASDPRGTDSPPHAGPLADRRVYGMGVKRLLAHTGLDGRLTWIIPCSPATSSSSGITLETSSNFCLDRERLLRGLRQGYERSTCIILSYRLQMPVWECRVQQKCSPPAPCASIPLPGVWETSSRPADHSSW
ncbi:hypothetical protein BU16DRAFT_287965 [Lophium mytilinum]|uniref:Uncharacterized protein n=1 Tax=Lophium mytilinum TaxID=390894 RepID=A0A6A6R166_9PEZI|nr:hypothetical protein BU16DRAFT_287965 [Lophium mytilinum]